MTKIQDTVTYFDGSVANGKIVVTWPPFQSGGVAVAAGQQEYPIAPDGSVTIECYPCVGAQPIGTYYTATYELDKGAVYDEYWLVPATPTATIGTIRVSVPETPSIMINAQQLTSGGAQSGMFLGWNGSNWVPMYPSSFNCAVRSFFGRTGDVMPQTGDYTVDQVTNAVPNTRRVIAGSGLSGGGPLTGDVTLSMAAGGFVPSSTQIIAGPGLSGGGPLTGNVTLSVTAGTFALQTTQIIAGTGLTGGGPLSGNVTLSVASGTTVPTSTQVIAGYGLSGGGPLTGNVTLTVVDNSSVQKLQLALAGALTATRHRLNFVAGSGINLNLVDDGANDEGTLTLTAVATGAPSPSIFAVNGNPIGTQPELNLIASTGVTLVGVNNTGAGRVDITISATGGGLQSPWASDINAAGFNLNDAGAIGIGVAAGARTLTIQGAAATSFDISAVNSNPAASLGMYLQNDSNDQVQFGLGGSNVGAVNLRRVAFLYTTRDILFGTGASLAERMRVTAAGLVGIGRTPTTYPLEVAGDVNLISGVYRVNGVPITTGGAAQSPWTSDINAANFGLFSLRYLAIGSASLQASPTVGFAVAGSSGLTSVIIQETLTTGQAGFVLNANVGQSSLMYNGSAATLPSQLILLNNTGGISFSAPTERMRITAGGLVGIGVFPPAYKLDIAGDCNLSAGSVYRINGVPITTGGGGTPAGLTGQVQFNNAGAFGASANLLWDNANTRLGVGAGAPATTLHVRGGNGTSGLSPQSYTSVYFENGSTTYLELAANASPGPPNCGIVWSSGAGQTSYMIDYNGAVQWVAVGASRSIQIFTNSAERMRITAAGNVGIGTTTPGGQLSLGTIVSDYKLLLYDGTPNFYGWGVRPNQFMQYCSPLAVMTFGVMNGATFTERMRIDTAGNVGIGTTAPAYLLDVEGGRCLLVPSSEPYALGLRYNASSTQMWLGLASTGNFQVSDAAGVGHMWITQGGSVGIGTATPQRPLEVLSTVAGGWAARLGNSSVFMEAGGFVDGASVAINSLSWSLALQTGGVTRVVITTAGAVGIGASPLSGILSVIPPTNPSTVAASNQVVIGESSNNAAYRLCLGYGLVSAGAWASVIQSMVGGASGILLLNPSGGGVVIGSTAASAYTLDVTGTIHCTAGFATTAKGNVFGAAAGNNTAIQPTDANIQLYNIGSGNWAGIGSDSAGGMWFRTGGGGTPDARLLITSLGNIGIAQTAPNFLLQLGADSAAKPATNTWTVVSDERTKRNIRPFTEGLDTLLQLRPTAFTYNGEASMPEGMEGVGLIAQEAAEVIPSCVRRTQGNIAGQETEVLALNTSDLQWMVLNALRQIDERLRKANL